MGAIPGAGRSVRTTRWLDTSAPLPVVVAALCLLATCLSCIVPGDKAPGANREDSRILVFAAASLQDVLEELAEPLRARTGLEAVFNFAGSNVLAQQARASRGADVFVSADTAWMDWLANAGRLVPGSRRELLSNRLVVISHPRGPPRLTAIEDLPGLEFEHLSIADPESVPAGRYAKALLSNVASGDTSVWEVVRDRVVPAPDVRAALALVGARADTIGLVYRTDQRRSEAVRMLLEVEADVEPPIRYSAALLKDGDAGLESGSELLRFLSTPRARQVFEEHGFLTLP